MKRAWGHWLEVVPTFCPTLMGYHVLERAGGGGEIHYPCLVSAPGPGSVFGIQV